jgi:peptidyl-dipeptidase Dcp
MRDHLAEIDELAASSESPTFANTVAAFDRAGRLLERVSALFLQPDVERDVASAAGGAARHGAAARGARQPRLHPRCAVRSHRRAARTARTHRPRPEQRRVLERFHLDFVRAGAKLAPPEQARYAAIMQRLAELTTRFGQNVLADESEFRLVLKDEADLAGLPAFVRDAARQAARERGIAEGAVITLSRSHIVPFLTFSERRDLREAAWRAWTSRGEQEGASDNRGVATEILQLRLEQARLHGYSSYADFALSDTMARSQAAVTSLLEQVWRPARARAEDERAALAALALSRGESGAIEPWDWRFYAEKVRQVRFDLDEAAVKPYFPLERMVAAAFDCAARLFGISFVARDDIVVYHPDVRVYEVHGAAGPIGLFLHDNFARPTKRSGAWMSSYRLQSRNGGDDVGPVLPIIVNNNNFAKGAPGAPTLLSVDDARTLFHEFGHGLHGLLSNVTYERVSGTNVLRDFVELPSQLFEHWLEEPAVLKRHARHHETGAPIPDALIERPASRAPLQPGLRDGALRRFGAGRHGGARANLERADRRRRLRARRARATRPALRPSASTTASSTSSICSPGSSYAAGYYVYLWAEVLDADGFDAFVEAGDPFDPAVARRLARFIYSSGNSIEPGEAYRAFRGRPAAPEPMLRQRGLLEPVEG